MGSPDNPMAPEVTTLEIKGMGKLKRQIFVLALCLAAALVAKHFVDQHLAQLETQPARTPRGIVELPQPLDKVAVKP